MSLTTLDHYELIQELTSDSSGPAEQQQGLRLNDFAAELGWRPSDQLKLPGTEDFSSGHIVVEHGLQNSAVISFLRRPIRYSQLGVPEQKALLNASYNNLIDWHIAVDYDSATYVYNRIDPPKFFSYQRRLSRGNTSHLSSQEFYALSTDHPSPNVPALDTALIRTISLWKRQLAADVRGISNEEISALFNSIILVRALEDHHKKMASNGIPSLRQRSRQQDHFTIRELLRDVINDLGISTLPQDLFDEEKLRKLDGLDTAAAFELIENFYKNRYEGYFDYDFSIMSKHALSRIYEHYVSLLRYRESAQESFFPTLPEETLERSYGNVYTPEFIARFFTRYLEKELPRSRFQRLKVGDPACGSGIFLRTMLEAKFQPSSSLTTQNISDSFERILGIDIDANACAAARLSISLLSLVMTNTVPTSLKIVNADALELFDQDRELAGSLDVVMANPPFVNIENLTLQRKELLLNALGDKARGKTDLYLGLLQVSLSMLKEGGFGLFVLPKNFLISDNAAPIRAELSRGSTLLCVVDLSTVRVFEEVGSYVVLVIFQKQAIPNVKRPVLVVRCNDLVGTALEDALQDREIRSPAYEVFWSVQPEGGEQKWNFVPPERVVLDDKLGKLPMLGDVVEIRQGLITGADDVFIVSAAQIPKREKAAYIPFLADREIVPYKVPDQTKRFVIYPFLGNEPLDEARFKSLYPETWQYLLTHKAKLKKRRSVQEGGLWWKPNRPREPRALLRTKIVTPHLVIAPKFALDAAGKYSVSHTPYIAAREPGSIEELMFFLGVLNSTPCFWLISQNAHQYSRGYSRLEVSTLTRVRVPTPEMIDGTLVRDIIRLVKMRLDASGPHAFELERLLDDKVADAYGLTGTDRRLVGLGAFQ